MTEVSANNDNQQQSQATVWLITAWSRETGDTSVIGVVRNSTEALQVLRDYMWPRLKYGVHHMDKAQLSAFRKTWGEDCPFRLIAAWNGHRIGLYIELVEHRLGPTNTVRLPCPV